MSSGEALKIELRLFGGFRKYETNADGIVVLEVPRNSSVKQVKDILCRKLADQFPHFSERGLIYESVLANQDRVLSDDETVADHHQWAILPPVCGG